MGRCFYLKQKQQKYLPIKIKDYLEDLICDRHDAIRQSFHKVFQPDHLGRSWSSRYWQQQFEQLVRQDYHEFQYLPVEV